MRPFLLTLCLLVMLPIAARADPADPAEPSERPRCLPHDKLKSMMGTLDASLAVIGLTKTLALEIWSDTKGARWIAFLTTTEMQSCFLMEGRGFFSVPLGKPDRSGGSD